MNGQKDPVGVIRMRMCACVYKPYEVEQTFCSETAPAIHSGLQALSVNPLYLQSPESQNHQTMLGCIDQEMGGTGKPQGDAPQTHLPTNLSTAPSQFSNPHSFGHPIPAGCEPIKMAVPAVVSAWLSMYCLTLSDSGNTFLSVFHRTSSHR